MAKKVSVGYVEVDNKPGALLKVLDQVATAGVDLRSLIAFAGAGGKGRIYFRTKDGSAAAGMATIEAISIKGSDAPGSAAAALKPLAEAGVDIIACGAYGGGGEMRLLAIVDDVDKAMAVLG